MPMRSFDRETSRLSAVLEESSLNLRICSCSIFEEAALITPMYCWNCCKLSRGPRLKLQRRGRTSVAKYCESQILPTCLKTFKAAIITAGSFVLTAFRSGTTFSWIVYLSNTTLLCGLEAFGPLVVPSRPSPISLSVEFCNPPQSKTNASSPRTFMARLLVLANTDATTGKTSCLIVEKSRTSSIVERQFRDLSTIEWV